MRNTTRDLLSIPALAIAAMAISATNVNAQCPGGCFGYPTPSRPAVRAFAPAVHYQPAMQFRTQTFVQAAPFVSAPQLAPIEFRAPVQSFIQPQFVQPQFVQQFAQPQPVQQEFAQPQFAPMITPMIEQTFVGQPAAIVTPMQEIGTPQYFPPAMPSVDNIYYPPQTSIISSGQIVEPMTWNSTDPIGSFPVEPADADMTSEIEEGSTDKVQEGQIEGEIISPENDPPASEMTPDKVDELPSSILDAPENTPGDPAEKKSESLEMQGDVDAIPLTPAKDLSVLEEADKAAEEKAAEDEAERLEAEKEKAYKKMEADKKKAAEMKAAEKKAAQEAKEKAKPKVVTDSEKITRLETSLKRQISRAKQVSTRDLDKALEQLKADNASDQQIAVAEKAAEVALEEKIKEIQARIQTRIDKLIK